ncbi:MAG TPA: VCBS repeat-containing protein [Herpetosiphonaceae bacterium]
MRHTTHTHPAHWLALTSLAVLLIVLFAERAFAQSATFVRTDYPLLGNTHIAADFNGDGKQDLAGSGLNAASVMLNTGDGTFRPTVRYPVAGQTQDLTAGDFNGDGNIDIVVTINTLEISLSLLTGNGDGTFNAPVHFPNTSGADADTPAEFGTDPDPDPDPDADADRVAGVLSIEC